MQHEELRLKRLKYFYLVDANFDNVVHKYKGVSLTPL